MTEFPEGSSLILPTSGLSQRARGSVRGRFAPSPTGDLHLGNARTALLAWLQVRRAGGTFVLRVEDLDVGRVRETFRRSQLEDLRWLGIDWDEGPDVGGGHGPYLQSLRGDRYETAIARLRALGLVYECWCSRKEIAAAASAPHAEDEEGPAYPGTCRGSDPRPGPAALRFRVSDEAVGFRDELRGWMTFRPGEASGDFVVRRKDGVAAYQLAVVVDDAAMSISDVLRGADLLPSTARQVLLYRALDLEPPRWTHVPLMLESDGERLSKREGSPTLRRLREAGVPPQRVVGWLAASCGLLDRARETTPQALVSSFDIGRLPRIDTPVVIPDWMEESAPTG